MLSTSDSDLQRFLRNLLLSAKNREDAIEKSQGLKKKDCMNCLLLSMM